MACGNLLPRNIGSSEISILYLDNLHLHASKSLITLLISTFVRNNFKFKESTLLLTVFFFQTEEVFKPNV